MLRRLLWVAPLGLALAGPALGRPKPAPKDAGPATPAAAPAASLYGAWLLVSAEALRENGQSASAFGDRASGMLVYDRSGEMSLQIAGERPNMGTVEAYQSLDPRDRMVFLDSYYAYFGTFEVDVAARQVVHRVRASLRPNETGISYRRQFTIEGDRLTLASPPDTHAGEMVTSRLDLRAGASAGLTEAAAKFTNGRDRRSGNPTPDLLTRG